MFLKQIDIYGSKMGLNLNGQPNFNSSLGGIFSIITMIIYILLFCDSSKDFFLKINPKVTSEKIYLTETVLNNFTITNETFIFAFYAPNYLMDPKIYKFSIIYMQVFQESQNYEQIDIVSCDKTKFSKLFDKIVR